MELIVDALDAAVEQLPPSGRLAAESHFQPRIGRENEKGPGRMGFHDPEQAVSDPISLLIITQALPIRGIGHNAAVLRFDA